jgi:hypothetical protein
LSLRGSGAVTTLGTGKNSAGGEDEDVAVRELLLELTGETVVIGIRYRFPFIDVELY